jgi:cellulose synthase/poly-beta-1,6-N-acetylglucosamine synthase-like glycosyltransferase
VAVRNEAENIVALIERLQSQDYPAELFELIIVNDHSTDSTVKTVMDLQAKLSISLIGLPKDRSGKKTALNYGIRHASGTLVITTDADCRPGKNWLRTIASYYQGNEYRMLSGPVAIESPKGFLARFQSLEFISLVSSGAGAIGSGFPTMCNGANLVYEKEAFYAVDGFQGNEQIPGGDDIFLLEKFVKNFGRNSIGFMKNTEAIVYTNPTHSLWAYLSQRFRWVAKSPAYKNPSIIFSAIVVLLLNLSLLVTIIGACFSTTLLLAFIVAFLLKCIIDLPLLWKASGFFKQRGLLWYYLLFQAVYFIFISISGILGHMLPYTWKGRK